jgi:hypothetical protein
VYYPDGSGATDLTTASSGNPAVEAFFYNQSTGTDGGVQIYGASKNWALHSEDVSNAAWVATNATKSTSSMTRPDGTTANTDVLTATAANGEVVQDTGDTAASDKWMFSIFVKCPSGTVAGKLRIRGTGGTPEESTTAFTATTTWQRVYSDYKIFTGSATGNASVGVSIDTNTEVLHLWGLMGEKANDNNYGGLIEFPGQYIKTEGATAVTASDSLSYDSSVMNPEKGTVMMFVNNYGAFTANNGGFMVYFSMNSGVLAGYLFITDTLRFLYNNNVQVKTTTFGVNEWNHVAFTWEQRAGGFLWRDWIWNGVSQTIVFHSVVEPAAADLYIGNFTGAPRTGSARGVISRLKVYNEALSESEIDDVYQAEKADYGL